MGTYLNIYSFSISLYYHYKWVYHPINWSLHYFTCVCCHSDPPTTTDPVLAYLEGKEGVCHKLTRSGCTNPLTGHYSVLLCVVTLQTLTTGHYTVLLCVLTLQTLTKKFQQNAVQTFTHCLSNIYTLSINAYRSQTDIMDYK